MKENLYNFLWIGVLYIYLILAQFLPKAVQVYVVPLGLVLIFVLLYMQELVIMRIVGKFIHLYSVIRTAAGSYRKHMYVENYVSLKVTRDIYRTELKLGMPVTLRGFGKVKRVYLYHNRPIEERWLLAKGEAVYNGVWVDHPQSDMVVLWETAEPVWDEGEIIPQFWLMEAGADRNRRMAQYLPEEGLREEGDVIE